MTRNFYFFLFIISILAATTSADFLRKFYICNIYEGELIYEIGNNLKLEPRRVLYKDGCDKYRCLEYDIGDRYEDYEFVGRFNVKTCDKTKYQTAYPGAKIYLHKMSNDTDTFVAARGFVTTYEYMDYSNDHELRFSRFSPLFKNRNHELIDDVYLEFFYNYYHPIN